MSLLDKLRELGISENLIKEIEKFRSQYPVDKEYESRIPVPTQFYYGSDVWEQAITAVLCGENLLLVGEKATGKNLFAENLAGVFNRPRWDVSFHVNMDAASLIGTDTFSAGEVTFRPGPVYTAAKTGGFAVIRMPMISKESLVKLIKEHYPAIREAGANELAEVFLELHAKCENGEISSKALDLRGLIGSIGMMEKGLNIYTALDMGITNKSFDEYEQTLIRDTIRARISRKMSREQLFC